MSYLIDTNVISELRKGRRCHSHVASWYESVGEDDLYLSVMLVGEVRKGIELARRRDPAQAAALERWIQQVVVAFAGRVLPITQAVADEWGRMNVPDPVPVVDGLLAATAKVHDLTLVTRNTVDVASTGARLLDPFQAQ